MASMLLSLRSVIVSRSVVPARCMATGTVKWFNVSKGFGFITPDDKAQPDVFAHHSAVQSSGFRFLKEGEAVTYDVANGDRGVQAVNITGPDGKPFVRPESAPRDAPGASGAGFSGPRRTNNTRRGPPRDRSASE